AISQGFATISAGWLPGASRFAASFCLACSTSTGRATSRQPNRPDSAVSTGHGRRMNAAKTCWGIYRELAHSPGRIDRGRAIMESGGAALSARGFRVELVAADAGFDTHFANIFVMCERGAVLDRLIDAEKSSSIVVNSPDAIRNTYRHRMVELFARHQ